jgi:hypothetical protein
VLQAAPECAVVLPDQCVEPSADADTGVGVYPPPKPEDILTINGAPDTWKGWGFPSQLDTWTKSMLDVHFWTVEPEAEDRIKTDPAIDNEPHEHRRIRIYLECCVETALRIVMDQLGGSYLVHIDEGYVDQFHERGTPRLMYSLFFSTYRGDIPVTAKGLIIPIHTKLGRRKYQFARALEYKVHPGRKLKNGKTVGERVEEIMATETTWMKKERLQKEAADIKKVIDTMAADLEKQHIEPEVTLTLK